MQKALILAAMTITLSACSNNYVRTNLDKENFSYYFAPTSVEIYPDEQNIKTAYKFVGTVEGASCQVKEYHAQPDEIEARTEARRQAASLGANGIVFKGCVDTKTQQCLAEKVCYGKAYLVQVEEEVEE